MANKIPRSYQECVTFYKKVRDMRKEKKELNDNIEKLNHDIEKIELFIKEIRASMQKILALTDAAEMNNIFLKCINKSCSYDTSNTNSSSIRDENNELSDTWVTLKADELFENMQNEKNALVKEEQKNYKYHQLELKELQEEYTQTCIKLNKYHIFDGNLSYYLISSYGSDNPEFFKYRAQQILDDISSSGLIDNNKKKGNGRE